MLKAIPWQIWRILILVIANGLCQCCARFHNAGATLVCLGRCRALNLIVLKDFLLMLKAIPWQIWRILILVIARLHNAGATLVCLGRCCALKLIVLKDFLMLMAIPWQIWGTLILVIARLHNAGTTLLCLGRCRALKSIVLVR